MSRPQLQRQLADKHWVRMFPSVYRVAGAPLSWHQTLRGVSLWAGQGFALSHHCAAALRGFARFKPGPVEVSATRWLAAPTGVVCHQVDAIHYRDLESLHGFTVTAPHRTLLDVAPTLSTQDLRASVDQALREKWTTVERLEQLLVRSKGRRGVAELRTLVDEYAGGAAPTESELEALVYELLDAAGFPRPIKQQVVMAGGRLRRIDFRFLGFPVVIEADGYASHSSPHDFERDRERNNALSASGLRVLHWTWRSLHDHPERLIAQLARLVPRAA